MLISGNEISDIAFNALQVTNLSFSNIQILNNTINNWDSDNNASADGLYAGGRAIRLLVSNSSSNPAITISGNTFEKTYLVESKMDEHNIVKVTKGDVNHIATFTSNHANLTYKTEKNILSDGLSINAKYSSDNSYVNVDYKSGIAFNISVENIKFTEKGLYIYGANDITIIGCTFENIADLISENADGINAIHLSWCTGNITIGGDNKTDGNTIIYDMDKIEPAVHKSRAIFIQYGGQNSDSIIAIKNNTISNIDYNLMQIYSYAAEIIIESNIITNWDSDNDSAEGASTDDVFAGGRAIRLSILYNATNLNPVVSVSNNTFVKDYLADLFTSNLGGATDPTSGYDDGNILKITIFANARMESLNASNNILALNGISNYYRSEGNPLFLVDDKNAEPTKFNVVIFEPTDGYYYESSQP